MGIQWIQKCLMNDDDRPKVVTSHIISSHDSAEAEGVDPKKISWGWFKLTQNYPIIVENTIVVSLGIS